MPATTTTFASILKIFYLGPVQKQLNAQAMVLALFKKGKFQWSGKQTTIPIHTARNTGVGARAEGASGATATLPTAGQQTYQELTVSAMYVYGTFRLTGPAMAAAKKGGGQAFVSWAGSEMEGLVEDITNYCNRTTVSGGRFKGYLCEHKASTVTTGVQLAAAPAGGQDTWQYSGDFTPFADCAVGTIATWVRIYLIRCDTGNPVDYVTTTSGHNPNFFVTGADSEAGTIDINYCTDTGAGDGFTTASVATGHAIAVALHPTQAVDSIAAAYGVNPATAMATNPWASFPYEPEGIYGNLSNPSHFGLTRHSADAAAAPVVTDDGQAPVLLCNVRTMSQAGAHTRIDMTLPRLQGMDDLVEHATGQSMDLLMMSALQRQRYMALLIGTIQVSGEKATKGDGGFSSFEFAGRKMVTDQHVDNGNIIFIKRMKWKMAEQESGHFADEDGNVLNRLSGFDAFEGFYKWYYNLVCLQPKANMILTGVTL